jgi:hypothetical protein
MLDEFKDVSDRLIIKNVQLCLLVTSEVDGTKHFEDWLFVDLHIGKADIDSF